MRNCKRYSEWMTDAALGTLASKQERELLAHAGECAACREAYQHAREVAALVDPGVESLISGEPSAQFAVRLRARIAQEGSSARFGWLSSKQVATGVAVLAAFAVLIVMYERRPHPQPPALNVAWHASSSANLPSAVVGPAREAAPRPESRARPQKQSHLLASASVRRERPIRARAMPRPEVLVPPGQFAAVVELARAIQTGRVDGKMLLAAEQRAQAPLKIDPIQITPLDPQPGSPSEAAQDGSH